MTYKEKLIEFNSTPKYKQELDFLFKLMYPSTFDHILDYGSGIGTAVNKLVTKGFEHAYGYDVNVYTDDQYRFRNKFYFKFEQVYFMHSIAHIPANDCLQSLKELLNQGAKLTVITPNKDWLGLQDKTNYNPDETVIEHFNIKTLSQLFIDNGFDIQLTGQFGAVTEHGSGNQNERIFLQATYE